MSNTTTDLANTYYEQGNALKEQGKLVEAAEAFRWAVFLDPNYADAYHNLGTALLLLGQTNESIEFFRKALAINPNLAWSHNNLGNAYNALGQLNEAAVCYQRTIAIDNRHAAAYNNLGNVFKLQHKLAQAAVAYREAIKLEPDKAEFHLNLGSALLLAGNWQPGWSEMEWRWEPHEFQLNRSSYFQPEWKGETLQGKTLLMYAEQGLGDTLQFIRYAKVLRSQGARIIFHSHKPLVQMLSRCSEIDQLISPDDPLPAFDYCIPLLSIPRILNTQPDSIPTSYSYLAADPRLIAFWSSRLVSFSGFRIGINWHGREGQGNFIKRNLPLELFSLITNIPGTQLFSLQKGTITPEEQIQLSQLRIHCFDNDFDTTNGPFMDTAAIMKNLDLVITSDTSVAHLGGALGVPTWVALPFDPDWRWLLDREDSPWYPTLRLFRQTQHGQWGDVFERMAVALQNKIKAG